MTMQYEVTGDGQPVVLVPGGLTGWLSWKPHAHQLSATRKVLRLQLLNVQLGLEGRALPDSYSVKTETSALGAALDDAGVMEPVDLVGWSFGGLVSLDFALDHPERIRTLTLIEPPAFWVLPERNARLDPLLHLSQRVTKGVSEEQLQEFLSLVGLLPPGMEATDLPQWPQFVAHRQSLRHMPAAMSHQDEVSRLQNFKGQALLVKGTGSATFLHEGIDRLAQHLPNSEVAEWPGGHAPHVVSMEPFMERLSEFHATAVPA